jgi:hypothetical protein
MPVSRLCGAPAGKNTHSHSNPGAGSAAAISDALALHKAEAGGCFERASADKLAGSEWSRRRTEHRWWRCAEARPASYPWWGLS